MDTANRRPHLPALAYLDIEKAKQDEDTYQKRNTGASQTYHSAPAASPIHQYPPGPPPPYSHPPPQHANSWPGVAQVAPARPDSRRASGEEAENIKQTIRQSLPSISEALGVDSQTSYPIPTSVPHPPPQPTHVSHPSAAPPLSPPSATRRAYGMEPPQTHNTYSNGTGFQYNSFRQDSVGPQQYPPSEPAKPLHTAPQDAKSPAHVKTSHRVQQQSTYAYPRSSSPQYEQSATHPAGPMGPPSFAYGYTPYPAKCAQPAPPSTHVSSGPIYQPSTQFAAPPTPSPSWKAESGSSRFGLDDRVNAPIAYGDSVKRHLDLYDLEGALNEIAKTSGIMMDFSRRYGDTMHQNARSGMSLATLPGMVEIEDMMAKSRTQIDSLAKIREVILAQQAAYEQHIADQQSNKAYAEPAPDPDHQQDEEETKGGFAGADAKKRRGRAAPPGRCHSCNRAETPEWRRGPDGARTLCNACGLHYAKLTRKQTGANKGANVASSNLRPKES